MTTWVRCALACGVLAVFASSSAAQDQRRIGLLFAFPGSVGVQWDVTDKFSLRADGGFSRSQFESTSEFGGIPRSLMGMGRTSVTATTVSTSQTMSIGVSAMWVIHSRDQLKVYAAPRIGVAVQRLNTETEYDLSGLPPALVAALSLPSLDDDFSETDTMPEAGAALGVSYRLADRFGVFAETGVTYTRGRFSSRGSFEASHSFIGISSGVGGVLYF